MYGNDLPENRKKAVIPKLKGIGIDYENQLGFFLDMMDKSGVDKVLVHANPNEGVAEMIKPHSDRFALFANVTKPDSNKSADELEYYVNSLGFKGVFELLPAGQHFFINDFASMDPLYKKAADLDVPIAWHLNDTFNYWKSRIEFSGNRRLQEVCYKYPDLKHILCHIGGLENYRHSLSAFSGYQNLYIDLSGISTQFLYLSMSPKWDSPASDRFLSYVYPDRVESPPDDHKVVMDSVMRETVKVFREAGNIIPNRIMFGTDTPFAARMEFEMEACRRAFGHDKDLLDHVLGETARGLLKV